MMTPNPRVATAGWSPRRRVIGINVSASRLNTYRPRKATSTGTAELGGQDRRGVGAGAIEGGVSDGKLSGPPHEELKAQGQRPVDQREGGDAQEIPLRHEPGRTARRCPASSSLERLAARSWRRWLGAGPATEEAGGGDEQDRDHDGVADGVLVRRGNPERAEGLDDAEEDAAHHGARHAAEASRVAATKALRPISPMVKLAKKIGPAARQQLHPWRR